MQYKLYIPKFNKTLKLNKKKRKKNFFYIIIRLKIFKYIHTKK